MQPKEESLAGYLLARTALHRKIEGPVLRNLRAGHASVQKVGELLPLGQANVRENLEKRKIRRPDARQAATMNLQEAIESMYSDRGMRLSRNDFYRMDAATSQIAKTGTCDDYAANTTAVHGAKLAAMNERQAIVAQVRSTKVQHTWSEKVLQGIGKYGKPTLHGEDVIMDGWCKENLAVLRDDSKFAHLDQDGNGDHLSHEHIVNHQSGPAVLARVEGFKAQIERSNTLQEVYHNEIKRRAGSGWKIEEKYLWDAQSAFHAEFHQQAGASLHKDFLTDIQAIGVARSLGANVQGAVAEAPGIIAKAKEMFPRPE
jgi:hypothetical protein